MPSSAFQSSGLLEFRVTEVRGHRNKGRFTSEGVNAQRQRNKELATRLQNKVADLIEERIRWRTESTGALARNTLSSANASYDAWSVAVGNTDFLDRSTSKYWRTAEQGSAVTWSHPFIGTPLWGRRGGKGGSGNSKGPLTGFFTDVTGDDNAGKKNHFFVRHETTPLHAYRDALIEVPLREFAVQNIRRAVQEMFE